MWEASTWLRPRTPGQPPGPSEPGGAHDRAPVAETGQPGGAPRRTLNCRYCDRPVTRPAERIEIAQRHLHRFVNPHGLSFVIGCFAEAPGVRPEGPDTDLWTWFPGYRWRLALCAGCGAHLGWCYSAGDRFFGLIVDRLVERSGDAPH